LHLMEKRVNKTRTTAMKASIPRRFREFFWDYPFSRLSWNSDRDLIILRVLSVGDWNAVQWLWRRLGNDELRSWIERRRGAGLNPRQLRFWELVLDLPKPLVDKWLQAPGRQTWDRRARR